MRWSRAAVPKLCGRCGHDIAKGAPLLIIGIGTRITKVRGVCCAGPAPPDLPTEIAVREVAQPLDLTRIGLLPLNWSREPGEEG